MSTDRRDNGAEPRGTSSREVFLSKLFTRGSTAIFLAISAAVTAVALGYAPLFNR
jgi:hypothetical protein